VVGGAGLERNLQYTGPSTLLQTSIHALPPTLHINIVWRPLGVNHHLLPLLPLSMANHHQYSLLMPLICKVRVFPCYSPDLTLVGYYPKKEFQVLDAIPNVSLLRQGFIGCTPVRPQLAVATNVYEFYTAARGVHPSFSVEAFTWTLCLLHKVS